MLKMRFSELFVIIGIFVIDLALLYQFLRYDTNGTLLCIFIFLSFFALLELCFRRGINPMGLMPRAWGRPLCGLLAALLFYCAWSEEGLAKDALIALSIIMMVVMLIYPIFAVFSDSPVRRTPSSPSVFPANPGQKTPGQGQARQTLLRRCTNARLAGITASHSPTASRSRHAFIIRIPV